MSVNSSMSSLHPLRYHCTYSKITISISSFILTKIILLVPLIVFVLYLGHQKWRRQRSFSTMSHSDIFTCHLAAMELMGFLGSPFYFCGVFSDIPDLITVGFCVSNITSTGEVLFHLLTCVERYLAVVHPITYLRLKKAGGVRIRNVSIGCIWLLGFGSTGVTAVNFPNLPTIPFSCFLIVSFLVVSFCSLRALCVLIRPGPGEVGGDRERVDPSKQRAFHTIMAIMGVLWLWFVGYLVCLVVDALLLGYSDSCLPLIYGHWIGLPNSLVLPLLFLHRAGKLPCHGSNAG